MSKAGSFQRSSQEANVVDVWTCIVYSKRDIEDSLIPLPPYSTRTQDTTLGNEGPQEGGATADY